MSEDGIRVNARRGYTVIPNGILPEGKVSARAWGVYVYLMSRPPGWECRVAHLRTVFTEGRDAMYSALRALVDADLMAKETYRDSQGVPRQRFVLLDPEAPRTEKPEPGRPDTDSPNPDSPNPENPDLSQYGSSTTTDVQSHSPHAAEIREDGQMTPDAHNGPPSAEWFKPPLDPFGSFWAAYPRKVGKATAAKAFTSACKRAAATDIIDGARRMAADPNLPAARFIPHPTTWLNRDGWGDDPYPDTGTVNWGAAADRARARDEAFAW